MSSPKDPPDDEQEDGTVERDEVIRDLTVVNEDSNDVLVEVYLRRWS